jgi:hypothetical protein
MADAARAHRDATEGRADRRRIDKLANEMQRAVAGVNLVCDGLPERSRVIVLNEALRDALDDLRRRQQVDALNI